MRPLRQAFGCADVDVQGYAAHMLVSLFCECSLFLLYYNSRRTIKWVGRIINTNKYIANSKEKRVTPMGKVKIKPIEEVYLELRADWDNPETFREIADRILEKEHGIQVTISGEPEITYQGEGLPNLVEYPVDVQLGSRGEAAKNIVPAVMGVWVPGAYWNKKDGYRPETHGAPVLSVSLAADQKIVLDASQCESWYYEESKYPTDWRLEFLVPTE